MTTFTGQALQISDDAQESSGTVDIAGSAQQRQQRWARTWVDGRRTCHCRATVTSVIVPGISGAVSYDDPDLTLWARMWTRHHVRETANDISDRTQTTASAVTSPVASARVCHAQPDGLRSGVITSRAGGRGQRVGHHHQRVSDRRAFWPARQQQRLLAD